MTISKNQKENIQIIRDIITSKRLSAPSEREFVEDWGINGNETISQLQEFASDYISEAHTLICENKNSWRYEV
jgi:hypothetical protein